MAMHEGFSKVKIVTDRIMEVKKRTRRTSGYVKIAIEDEIIDKIVALQLFREPLPMTCLSLCWDEPKKEEVKPVPFNMPGKKRGGK